MSRVEPGMLVRWRDPQPDQMPLGIVLAQRSDTDPNTLYVLMSGDGGLDVEVFVGRPDETGVSVSDFLLESMEVAEEEGDSQLGAGLRQLAPHGWHLVAHLGGDHEEVLDGNCPLCQVEAEQAQGPERP